MTDAVDTVVIGGGVIGTACAHYLSQRGQRVSIVEQGRHGAACSRGNCGYVCPSHVLPLTEPGAIKEALKSLFRRNSPFRVKPRFDLALWSWLIQFGRRCRTGNMLQAGHAIQALLKSSMSLFEELVTESGIQCEWEKKGLLYVYRSREKLDAFTKTNELMTEHFQEPARRIEAEELAAMEPALLPGMAGGWYYEHDAHLRSDYLMQSWGDVLRSRGVTILEQCAVEGFVERAGRGVAIQTTVGEIEAKNFVVATGAWAPFLRKELGCKLPIQPGKGYSLTMPRPKICPAYPLLFPETRVGVTPWASGYRLGSTMEFAGYDSTIDPKRVELLREGSRDYLQEPYCEPVLETWYGWRPMTYDSLPIIDRSPKMSNVYIAAGHNMLGLSMSTGTGKLIAEWITGEPLHLDISPYSVRRF